MKKNNYWENMYIGSQKRIESLSSFELYWIVTEQGKFGIIINFKEFISIRNLIVFLKGIEIDYGIKDGVFRLSLIIKDNNDWEIFSYICNDLVNIVKLNNSAENTYKLIEKRLKQWQYLLSNNFSIEISIEQQMGLFAELYFIVNRCLEKQSIEQIIDSWEGPNFEKQDFIFSNATMEIKSFKSGNEPIIKISSKYQLNAIKENNYLIAYALSFNETGDTIKDLCDKVISYIKSEILLENFKAKLNNYSFDEKIHEKGLKKFKVDRELFFLVDKEFPKIDILYIVPEIQKITYNLDLSMCSRFKIDKDKMVF